MAYSFHLSRLRRDGADSTFYWRIFLATNTPDTEKTMFIGEYTHTLDPKKRLALPSKFRKEIGKKAVVTKGLENCIFVYTMKGWEKVTEDFSSLPMTRADARAFNRNMFGGAYEVEIDSLGRVLIPEVLKTYAGLKKNVSVLGVSDRIEIWDEKRWTDYRDKVEKQVDQLAEKLSEERSQS